MFRKRKLYTSIDVSYPTNNWNEQDEIVLQLSPVDSFERLEIVQGDKSVATCISSDVYMLFNQQRLEKISPQTLQNFLDNLSSGSSQMLKGKYSDEELMAFVKSRYIQAPSEIKAWSEYLNKVAEEMQVDLPTDDPQPTNPQPTDPLPTE